ncbi:hypothetical protein NDU88_004978 [Pleurodeles waltl]|uniref:Uncharacterized protein n=1 Tax=Pleurodeles waltl TaxID=8319 RepID=A0AAV7RKP8_PLEWA|nr:hypothetical protein NDU88_004978 [Pleurodeles waltl]
MAVRLVARLLLPCLSLGEARLEEERPEPRRSVPPRPAQRGSEGELRPPMGSWAYKWCAVAFALYGAEKPPTDHSTQVDTLLCLGTKSARIPPGATAKYTPITSLGKKPQPPNVDSDAREVEES